MSFLQEELQKRRLPELLPGIAEGERITAEQWQSRRAELLDIMRREMFGYTPDFLKDLKGRVTLDSVDTVHTCAGKVETRKYLLHLPVEGGEYAVPFIFHLPKRLHKPPVILHIAFRREYPDRYLPVEEITDRGYALVHFCYHDATPDLLHGNFSSGLAEKWISAPRVPTAWGKIGVWAFVASRIMDWLAECDEIDGSCVSLSGHSRLGKTTLWCAAQDERFYCAYGNDCGYGGSGLIRGKRGENIKDFLLCGSWDWFCERFKSFERRDAEELPYDMHFVLAAIAPRHSYIASAEEDTCMDYKSDFLSLLAASKVYRALGLKGLVSPDAYPIPDGFRSTEGTVGHHVRSGLHFLSRTDWNLFMDFLDAKRKEDGK